MGDEALGIESGPAVLGAEGGFDAGKDGDPADAAVGQPGGVTEEGRNRMPKVTWEAGDGGGGA